MGKFMRGCIYFHDQISQYSWKDVCQSCQCDPQITNYNCRKVWRMQISMKHSSVAFWIESLAISLEASVGQETQGFACGPCLELKVLQHWARFCWVLVGSVANEAFSVCVTTFAIRSDYVWKLAMLHSKMQISSDSMIWYTVKLELDSLKSTQLQCYSRLISPHSNGKSVLKDHIRQANYSMMSYRNESCLIKIHQASTRDDLATAAGCSHCGSQAYKSNGFFARLLLLPNMIAWRETGYQDVALRSDSSMVCPLRYILVVVSAALAIGIAVYDFCKTAEDSDSAVRNSKSSKVITRHDASSIRRQYQFREILWALSYASSDLLALKRSYLQSGNKRHCPPIFPDSYTRPFQFRN